MAQLAAFSERGGPEARRRRQEYSELSGRGNPRSAPPNFLHAPSSLWQTFFGFGPSSTGNRWTDGSTMEDWEDEEISLLIQRQISSQTIEC